MNADKDSFKAHVKKHSKVPPKHCVLCGEGEADDFDLRQHVQTDVSSYYTCNSLLDCGDSEISTVF